MNRIKLLAATIVFFSILSWFECTESLAEQNDEAARLVPSEAFAVLSVGSPEKIRQEIITIANNIQPAMADYVRTSSINTLFEPFIQTTQAIDLSRPMMLAIGAPADPNAPRPYMTLILAVKGAKTENIKVGQQASSAKAQLVFLPNSEYIALTTQPGLKASANAPEIVKNMLMGDMNMRVDVRTLLAAIPDNAKDDSPNPHIILKNITQIDWALKLGLKETQTITQFTCDGKETLGASDVYAMSNLASYLPADEMMYCAADLGLLNAIMNFDENTLKALNNDAKMTTQLMQALEDAKAVMATMKDGCAVSMDVQGDDKKNTQMSMFMVTKSDTPQDYFDASLKEWKSEESLYGINMSSHTMTTAASGDVTLNASFKVDDSAKQSDLPFVGFFQQLMQSFPGPLNITGVSGHGLVGVAALMGGQSDTSTSLKKLQSGKAGPAPAELAMAMKSDWGQLRMAMTMDLRKLAQALIKVNPEPGNFGQMIRPPGSGKAAPVNFNLSNKDNQYRLVMTTNLEQDIALAKDATKNTFFGMFWQTPQFWMQMKQGSSDSSHHGHQHDHPHDHEHEHNH